MSLRQGTNLTQENRTRFASWIHLTYLQEIIAYRKSTEKKEQKRKDRKKGKGITGV